MIIPVLEDIGRGVIYTPGHPSQPREAGVLTHFNRTYCFVRFGADKHPKACRHQDLSWEEMINVSSASLRGTELRHDADDLPEREIPPGTGAS